MRSREMVSADVRLAHAVLGELPDAFSELIARVGPTVRARIRKVLARSGAREQHDARDLEQDIYFALFRRRRRVIGAWDPNRGLALTNFVGLFAERAARSLVRRRAGARERCFEGPHFECLADARTPERRAIGQQQIERVWCGLTQRFGSGQISLLRALLMEGASTESVCNTFGLTPAAVYQARHRALRELKKIGEQVDAGVECPGDATRSQPLAQARFVHRAPPSKRGRGGVGPVGRSEDK